jgi:hypothetical protein
MVSGLDIPTEWIEMSDRKIAHQKKKPELPLSKGESILDAPVERAKGRR